MNNKPVNISMGLKFKSTSFSDSAEVVLVKDGKVDVMITSSQGHSRILKDWDINHVKARFESGEYMVPDKGPNYSVW
jgi:hypothetical protein